MINLYYDIVTPYGPVSNAIQDYEITSQGQTKFPVNSNRDLYGLINPVPSVYDHMVAHGCQVDLYTDNNFTEDLFYPIEVLTFVDVTKLIPETTLSNMKNGIFKVLILFQEEGADGWAFDPIKKIAQTLLDYGVALENIYIIIGDLNLSYVEYFKPFNIFSIDWWQIKHQMTCKTRYRLVNSRSSRPYDLPLNNERLQMETFDIESWTSPSKIFLSFNGHARIHRVGFVSELLARGLDQIGYLSFGVHPNAFTYNQSDDRIVDNKRDRSYIDKKNEKINFLKTNSLVVDGEGHSFFDSDDRRFNSKYFYDSAFTIVTETFAPVKNLNYINDEYNVLWTTEKTWKPIAIGHPFMLLGSIGTMKYLQDEGYHTFSEMFDESYDSEPDLIKRIDLIADNIERLASLPKTKLYDIIESIKPKLKENKELFYAKNHSSKFYNLFNQLRDGNGKI